MTRPEVDVLDRALAVARRWFVWVPLLALTVAATWHVSDFVKPSFEAQGSVLLVPPTGKPTTAPGSQPPVSSGWTLLGPVDMATAVIKIMESGERRAAVAAAGFERDYVLTLLPRSAIIRVQAASLSPARVTGTVGHVIAAITADVAGKQAALADQPRLRISTQVLDGTAPVDTNILGVRKAQAIVVAVGLALTIVGLIAAEAVARAWRRRAEMALRGMLRSSEPQ
ncbi:hypothetical protein AB0M43_38540 [Longispora sp. NPDC051575]|uniref:hypothetical protein n=1 Tax=Longispora sp. NPDC051575 TaxID=3154943 RepID=UPI003417F561